jgi:DNA-binding protein HU-beta
MNKTELVKKVGAENALSQKQAAAVVDSVLGAVVDTVAAGESVALFGFGTFSLKHRDAREGRNPATGKTMQFAASNTPVFKAGKAFKEKVNK